MGEKGVVEERLEEDRAECCDELEGAVVVMAARWECLRIGWRLLLYGKRPDGLRSYAHGVNDKTKKARKEEQRST